MPATGAEMSPRGTIDVMTDKPNYRQPGGTPTEYGGRSGDNRRTPTGRVLPGTAGQQATDVRREGVRGQDTWPIPRRLGGGTAIAIQVRRRTATGPSSRSSRN